MLVRPFDAVMPVVGASVALGPEDAGALTLPVAVPAAPVVKPTGAARPAPVAGPDSVTLALGTGLSNWSVTRTLTACGNWVPTVVVCGPPAVIVTAAGMSAVLVSEKLV